MNKKVDHTNRLHDIIRFYEILDDVEQKVGGTRILENCDGRMEWPKRGVYFFFEPGEMRSTSGDGLRVVRVGTHSLKRGGKATLWKRLRQHRGTLTSGGGNHRGSIFRWHIGTALIKRDNWYGSVRNSWTVRRGLPKRERQNEIDLEVAVSEYIRKMPFLWLEVDDESGPKSKRGCIERNAIALLSNYNHRINQIDPQSPKWLGNYASNPIIAMSGLWNVDHVEDPYDSDFLENLLSIVN